MAIVSRSIESEHAAIPAAEVVPASRTDVIPAPDVAREINDLHRDAMENAKTAVDNAMLCGRRLLEQKEKLGHGHFRRWCQLNLELSPATVTRYLRAARITNDHRDHFRAALAAIAPDPIKPPMPLGKKKAALADKASGKEKPDVASPTAAVTLTLDEYQCILDCLEPERDVDKTRLSQARKIVMRFERLVDRAAKKPAAKKPATKKKKRANA